MKKLILLLTLLACVVVVGDVKGYEEIGLEEWCKIVDQSWDLSGTCFVDNEVGLYERWAWDLTIDTYESLVFVVGTFDLRERPPNIVNNGTIKIKESIIVRNCLEIINNGTIHNAGHLQNGQSGTWKGLQDCFGTLINNEQGTIYNYGSVVCEEGAGGGEFYSSDCKNFGRVYNICNLCAAQMPCGETSGRIHAFPTENITVDHCGYLPIIPKYGVTKFISEYDALMALYNSTNGPGWKNTVGWGVGFPCDTAWYGVECDSGHVQRLSLIQNQLSGPIPPELGNLSSLIWLNLSENQLSGPIPPELVNLHPLAGLNLGSNELNGPIPAELGNLRRLKELYLYGNQLNGPIPAELGNLSSLKELYLYGNQLNGPIPAELGNLRWLERLDLGNNQLSGLIPAELSHLGDLKELYLYGNQLNGPIPAELGNLHSFRLERLYLNNNQLNGPIPAELGNLSRLAGLDLGNNQLSGPIPAELGNLSRLKELYLYGNQLSGPIPAELGNLSSFRLERLDLNNNQLNGPIPAELSHLSHLYFLDLRINPGLECWETDEALNWALSIEECWYKDGEKLECLPSYFGPTEVCQP